MDLDAGHRRRRAAEHRERRPKAILIRQIGAEEHRAALDPGRRQVLGRGRGECANRRRLAFAAHSIVDALRLDELDAESAGQLCD